MLAAGLGNARLAPMVGLAAPVTPNKGQIIVLERVRPFLSMPLETIRQTDEGTVLVGDAQQDRGFDEALDTGVLAAMATARRATVPVPARRPGDARVGGAARDVAGRISDLCAIACACPGAFLVDLPQRRDAGGRPCARPSPDAVRAGALPAECAAFGVARFDVRAAA